MLLFCEWVTVIDFLLSIERQRARNLAQTTRLLAPLRHRQARLWEVAGHPERPHVCHHRRALQSRPGEGWWTILLLSLLPPMLSRVAFDHHHLCCCCLHRVTSWRWRTSSSPVVSNSWSRRSSSRNSWGGLLTSTSTRTQTTLPWPSMPGDDDDDVCGDDAGACAI